MVEFMEKVSTSLGDSDELTVEERNLLSVAYKNVIGARHLHAQHHLSQSPSLEDTGSISKSVDTHTQILNMLLLSPLPTSLPPLHRLTGHHNATNRTNFRQSLKVNAMAKEGQERGSSTAAETAAIVGGLIATPVIGWSLYTLKTMGCGLPPGPGGSIGALEGVSYLAVVGIVAWSLYTKTKTGTGLPNGPFGLLGAVEGLPYLTLLAIIVVFGLQFFQQGSIPGPLPSGQCFG